MYARVIGGRSGALLLKSPQVARSNPVSRRYNRTVYCAVSSSGEREGEPKMDGEKEKRPPAEHDESKIIVDPIIDSFGEGYSTRCVEEGFGGVYGGKDPDHLVNHPEFDKSQGSEVKEKEKARNLPPGAHTA